MTGVAKGRGVERHLRERDTAQAPKHTGAADTEAGAGAWQPRRSWRIIALTVLVLAGLGYLLEAWQLPTGTAEQPGHGLYPRIAGLVLLVPLVGVLVAEMRGIPDSARGTEGGSWLKPMVNLGVVLAYVLAAPTLGHIVTSAAVFAVVLRLMGTRRWWHVTALAVICAVASYGLIVTLLGLPLPSGQLGLEF